jgi:type IV secretion system protein TrbL
MRLLPRAALLCAVALLASLALLAPEPPRAEATSLPCIGVSPGGVVGEALGLGNPLGDACEAVTDPILGAAGDAVIDPLKDAAGAIGQGVFDRVTGWVAEGAVWLIGEVAGLSQKTTAPNLRSKGFVRQYRLMTSIAVSMAALMLIFAVLESLGRGDLGMLGRVFLVNAPLAAIATSAAYVVVQLLVASCDVMSATISRSTGADSEKFLHGVLKSVGVLGGGLGGAAGAIQVPSFVALIAVAMAAFAAFIVWIELLMRDAAIYVVALFMPLGIAASIWPRWTSALRRTCELVIVLVFSKFVIVAVIALAASMLAAGDGSVEHVLAAGSMLLLACFSPFVLFKLVPFAEGAIGAASSRQSAASGAVRGVETANPMKMVQRLSRANWAAASGREGGEQGPGGSAGGKKPVGGPPGGGSAGGQAAGAGGAAAGGTVALGAVVGTAQGAKRAGERLGRSDEAKVAGAGGGEPGGAGASEASAPSAKGPPRPPRSAAGGGERAGTASPGEGGTAAQRARAGTAGARVAEPSDAKGGGGADREGSRPARPAAGKGTAAPKAGPA